MRVPPPKKRDEQYFILMLQYNIKLASIKLAITRFLKEFHYIENCISSSDNLFFNLLLYYVAFMTYKVHF